MFVSSSTETNMSFYIIEVKATTKDLRDTALEKARRISRQTRKLLVMSVGMCEDSDGYFFTYIAPDGLWSDVDIIGYSECGNRAELRVLCRITSQSSLEILTGPPECQT